MSAVLDTEIFYDRYVGRYPFVTFDQYEMTRGMLEHLQESLGRQYATYLPYILNWCKKDGFISPDNLPKLVYEGSLAEKDVYHYHLKLNILPPPSVVDLQRGIIRSTKYYKERRERFTMGDLLKYTYEKLCIPDFLCEDSRDSNALIYLLTRYRKNPYVPRLDFLLYLIDIASESERRPKQIIGLNEFEVETAEIVSEIVENINARQLDHYVWRWEDDE